MSAADIQRLVGLIEGEGCFTVSRNTRGNSYVCKFLVKMRADDEPFLRATRDQFGRGTIAVRNASVRDGHARQPFVQWSVERKADCLALIDVLDAHPLRSKKARDYAIWREAALAWRLQEWDSMRAAFLMMPIVRKYRTDECFRDNTVVVPALLFAFDEVAETFALERRENAA